MHPVVERRAPRRLGAILLLALAVTACARAASVLFDLPEPAVPAPASAAAAAAARPAPADTPPPPLEAVTSRDSLLLLLPKHSDGGLDWSAALRDGIVAPRRTAPAVPSPGYLETFGYDVFLKGPAPAMDALFPHSAHAPWLACSTCHPAQVRYGRAAQDSARSDHTSCGTCHRAVAFPMTACSRCHPGVAMGSATASVADDLRMARADSSDYPRSRFGHATHRIRYRCSACHTDLFAMRTGADTLSMSALRERQACGACHDGHAAFALADCARCHTREP